MVPAGIAEREKPQAPTLIIVGGVVTPHCKLAVAQRLLGNRTYFQPIILTRVA